MMLMEPRAHCQTNALIMPEPPAENPLSPAPRLRHRGRIFAPRPSPYERVLWPWAQVKNLFQRLYRFCLRLLWAELLEGKTEDEEWLNLLLFVLFLFLSWLSYRLSQTAPWVAFSFFVLWYLDYALAVRGRRQGQAWRALELSEDSAGLWQWRSQVAPFRWDFTPEQARRLTITLRELRAGAFSHRLGRVWQLKLLLMDQSDWLLAESERLADLLALAQPLQTALDLDCVFADSAGWGSYAEQGIVTQSLALPPGERPGVGCQITSSKWHIFSRWRWADSWAFLKELIRESGFLIFALLASGFMLQTGRLMDGVLTAGTVTFSFNFGAGYSWLTLLSLVGAVGVLVYRGWQLSRQKHTVIDRHFLRFSLDQYSLGKLPTQDVVSALFSPQKDVGLVFLTADQALILPPLPQESDNLRYLQSLYEALVCFQRSPEEEEDLENESTPDPP